MVTTFFATIGEIERDVGELPQHTFFLHFSVRILLVINFNVFSDKAKAGIL